MYKITLTSEDVKAIEFSGYRYSWSDTLEKNNIDTVGTHDLPEHIAWEINDSIFADDNAFCPLLSHDCNLAKELLRLNEEII